MFHLNVSPELVTIISLGCRLCFCQVRRVVERMVCLGENESAVRLLLESAVDPKSEGYVEGEQGSQCHILSPLFITTKLQKLCLLTMCYRAL